MSVRYVPETFATMTATILTKLAQAPEFTDGCGCTAQEITNLETTAGGKFPDTYRQFLEAHGFAIWDGGMLYGRYELGSALPPSYDLDAARQTEKARTRRIPACFARVSGNGLVVSKYEGGGFYFLRTDPARAGVVELYEFGEDGGPTGSWPSIEAFLASLLPGGPAGT